VYSDRVVAVCCSVLQCAAVCCSVLQCVEVCCGVLQRVAVWCSALQCIALYCIASQCVAACYSVLQRVAACYSVLQCVAVCCSVLQYATDLRRIGYIVFFRAIFIEFERARNVRPQTAMCDMTHSHVYIDPFICVTHPIRICDATHSCV